MEYRPKARTEGVVAEWVADELVVYDERTQTAHCLSARAAAVRDLCGGRLSAADIAERLALAPTAVEQAVEELARCGLLDDDVTLAGGYSRRDATVRFAKAGGAAFAAPLIYSLAVGPAASAASACIANNSPAPACTATSGHTKADARCCSGTCYNAGSGTLICAAGTCVVLNGICIPGLNQCCAGPNHCSGGVPSVCVA